ncbi:DNA polymerase epsilon subunit C [Carica papaya]|uniref:DNA polymerase epsilon subunit C n=1 Tax=Carica papaya TaxID=3649 RepID=UPI000B8CBE89|nr:DNA polymerase epsilon subunit C [Carica papaya]
MASLKKSNEAKDDEKKKKKKTTGSSTTKPTSKIEKKKTSSTKNLRKPNPKTCSNKKNKATQNGTVEDPVIVEVTPSSSDSEKENEEEQNPKSNGKITKNPPAKVTSPRKRSKKERGGDEGNGAEKGEEKICKIPINRTKRIIKSEDPDCLITQEALFLVNKATEMLIEKFCEDAYKCSVEDRKKNLHYKHLSSVVSKETRYEFLSDFVPEKVTAEDALAQSKLAERGAG